MQRQHQTPSHAQGGLAGTLAAVMCERDDLRLGVGKAGVSASTEQC